MTRRTRRAEAISGVAYETRLHAEALCALVENIDEEAIRLKAGTARAATFRWLAERVKWGAREVDEGLEAEGGEDD